MLRLIALGLAGGAGVQAFRQWPADGPVTPTTAIVVFIAGLLSAFLGGLWLSRGRGARASATAIASAEAQATGNVVNVVVAQPGTGARAYGLTVPDPASVSWFGGTRGGLTADDLDGMELSELMESPAQEEGQGG